MATSRVNPTRHHFSRLERAHIDLTRALSALPPHRIIGNADAADVEARADHLHQVFCLTAAYIDAVILDTMNHMATATDPDWLKIELILGDAVNDPDCDLVGQLMRAGVRFDLQAAEAA
jgi:hypothetical protein